MEKMECAKIRYWNRTHKIMKWKLALRITTSPSERWVNKAAEWNPELSSRYRTNRAIGRPRKTWEDDINEFLKQVFEENENPIESSNQTNKTWIQHSQRPQKMDSSRRNLHNDRVRTTEVFFLRQKKPKPTSELLWWSGGVRPSDEETANITAAAPQHRFASINKMTHLKAAADMHSRTSRWVDA